MALDCFSSSVFELICPRVLVGERRRVGAFGLLQLLVDVRTLPVLRFLRIPLIWLDFLASSGGRARPSAR